MSYFPPSKLLWIILTLVVGLSAVAGLFPEATVRTWSRWTEWRAAPSLDRDGGCYLVLAPDPAYVRNQALKQIRDSVRFALNEVKVPHTRVIRGDAVEVRVRDPNDAAKAGSVLRGVAQPVDGSSALRDIDVEDVDVQDMGGGNFHLTIPETAMVDRLRRTVEQSITIVEKRLYELGTAEPIIRRLGFDRIEVQVPGMSDPTRLKEFLGRTAQMEFRMIDTTVSPEQARASGPPPGSEVLASVKSDKVLFVVKTGVLVAGGDLVDAQPGFDPRTNEPIVNFRFSSLGGQRFARATTENVGVPFAMVLDHKVVSAPVIREPITGGQGQISGNFTVQEAADLAILLRSGALPVPLTVVEERITEPRRPSGAVKE
ncbi:MAG: hypothetical protein FWD68_08705 [Alphaproteobacteria bacterium]|nr:hypothetical protein [Alphaproteobacteria bacterium]